MLQDLMRLFPVPRKWRTTMWTKIIFRVWISSFTSFALAYTTGDGDFKFFLADEPAAAGELVGMSFTLFRPRSNRVLACRFCSFLACDLRHGPFPSCCARPEGPAVPTCTSSPQDGHTTVVDSSYLIFSFAFLHFIESSFWFKHSFRTFPFTILEL